MTASWFMDAVTELEDGDRETIVLRTIDDLTDDMIDYGISEGFLTEEAELDEWSREIAGFLVERRKQYKEVTPVTEILAMQEVVNSFTDDECASELDAAQALQQTDALSLEWIALLKARLGRF